MQQRLLIPKQCDLFQHFKDKMYIIIITWIKEHFISCKILYFKLHIFLTAKGKKKYCTLPSVTELPTKQFKVQHVFKTCPKISEFCLIMVNWQIMQVKKHLQIRV